MAKTKAQRLAALRVKLTPAEQRALLRRLRGWTVRKGHLEREYRYKDFDRAYRAITHVARIAKALDHHPDLALGWGYLKISLTTHSAGGLTRLDFIAAERMGRRASWNARR